jgi:L-threo-3-deoxy-hexylosonate aldolase
MTRLTSRPLPKGIYTPLPTFFKPSEDLDLEAYKAHVRYVAAAGTAPVIAGSAGEAPHLTSQERSLLIQTARNVLDDGEGTLSSVPIVAGVGAPSTRETIQLAHDAKAAGADYAMVLPSGYYAGQLSNRTALTKYFVDVAEASPLPIVLYNFPAVSGGIDLDSDLIVDVIKACPNVVGVKLTYVIFIYKT